MNPLNRHPKTNHSQSGKHSNNGRQQQEKIAFG
jgi:hypothetical protein